MKKFSMVMLGHWLEGHVLRSRPGSEEPRAEGGIRLLDEDSTPLASDCLYVGTMENTIRALQHGRVGNASIAIIIARGVNMDVQLTMPRTVTVIITDMDLITLYNHLQERVRRYLDWEAALRQTVYESGGLEKLLQKAAEAIDATILLVNPGYRHIASVVNPAVSEPTAVELQEHGYLAYDTIQAIHHEKSLRQSPDGELVEYVSRESGNYTIVRLIRYQESLVARLCFVLRGPEPNAYYSELTRTVAKYAAEYMLGKQGAVYGANAEFGSLVADLIERRLVDQDELDQRLKQVKLTDQSSYHVALVHLNGCGEVGGVRWNYVTSQLERIFRHSNIAAYRGSMLVLSRRENMGSRQAFDMERLMRILEQYDGYVALGSATEQLMSLPLVYQQTRDTLRIAQVIDPSKRVYFFDDYAMYQLVELAANAERDKSGSQDMTHLCCAEVITLILHDKKHGGDLSEVLRAYLRNERNATTTARELYIHRNTMLYKIHKIEEIIGVSLDDPMLRERILFSYRVLEYMQRYQKEDTLIFRHVKKSEG